MKNDFMLFKDGKTKALTFSYDDGVMQDKRLVEILRKNGLKGTARNILTTMPITYANSTLPLFFNIISKP